ncbi:hypothetical protein [Acholeplasma hippikon]|nr:hypothetical protein [Acholeplasma hippikon]
MYKRIAHVFLFIMAISLNLSFRVFAYEGDKTPNIEYYQIKQLYDGSLYIYFYQENDLAYPESTHFTIEGLGTYQNDAFNHIYIPAYKLSNDEQILHVNAQIDGLSLSDVSDILIFSFQTDEKATLITKYYMEYQNAVKSLADFNLIDKAYFEEKLFSIYLKQLTIIKETEAIQTLPKDAKKLIFMFENILSDANLENVNTYYINLMHNNLEVKVSKIDEVLKNIVNAYEKKLNDNEVIEEAIIIYEEANKDIDDYLSVKINEAKNELRTNLLAYQPNYHNEETRSIIDRDILLVNSKNYNDELSMHVLKEFIMQELDQVMIVPYRLNALNELDTYLIGATNYIDDFLINLLDESKTLFNEAINYSEVNKVKEDLIHKIDSYIQGEVRKVKECIYDELSIEYSFDDEMEGIILNSLDEINAFNYQNENVLLALMTSIIQTFDSYILEKTKVKFTNELMVFVETNYLDLVMLEANFIDGLINMLNESLSLDSLNRNYDLSLLAIENKVDTIYKAYLEKLITDFDLLTSIYPYDFDELKNEVMMRFTKMIALSEEKRLSFENDLKEAVLKFALDNLKKDTTLWLNERLLPYEMSLPNLTLDIEQQFNEGLINVENELDLNQLIEQVTLRLNELVIYNDYLIKFDQIYQLLKHNYLYTEVDDKKLDLMYETYINIFPISSVDELEEKYNLGVDALSKIPRITLQNHEDALAEEKHNNLPNHAFLLIGLGLIFFLTSIWFILKRNKQRNKNIGTYDFLEDQKVLGYNHVIYLDYLNEEVIEQTVKLLSFEQIKELTEHDMIKEDESDGMKLLTYMGIIPAKNAVSLMDEDEETSNDGIIYNYSFMARLIQAPLESQKRYSDLKNYILSYPNVQLIKSFKNERYMYKNRTICKLWIHGQNIKVYLNLDINLIDKDKYTVTYVGDTKKHETTPLLYTINGPRNLKYAYELIDMYFKDGEVKENKPYYDYTKKYLDKQTLISRDLIRVKYTKIKEKGKN